MPEVCSEYATYAYEFSPEAVKIRRQLPMHLQAALFDVIDNLATDPEAYPHRTRAFGRGGLFLYTHPQPPLEITYELDRPNRRLFLVHIAAPVVQLSKPVFVSYSHADQKWLEKLRLFLKPLEQQGLIRIWDDREIQVGSTWLAEIQKSLQSARFAILLVTQHFLASDFIQQEELAHVCAASR